VVQHTDPEQNRKIREEMRIRISYYGAHPEKIEKRLRDLDREWDTERTLEANAATLALSGTLLGLLGRRRYLLLPAVVTGFLLQHALQGWCPPLSVIRRLGVRTPAEIEAERYALKALRGDFDLMLETKDPQERIDRVLQALGLEN